MKTLWQVIFVVVCLAPFACEEPPSGSNEKLTLEWPQPQWLKWDQDESFIQNDSSTVIQWRVLYGTSPDLFRTPPRAGEKVDLKEGEEVDETLLSEIALVTEREYDITSYLSLPGNHVFGLKAENLKGERSNLSKLAAIVTEAAPDTTIDLYSIAVNCGGGHDDINGIRADQAFDGFYGYIAPNSRTGRVEDVDLSDVDILGDVWNDYRYWLGEYKFVVPNGIYEVTIGTLEPHYDQAGQRIFGISVNGVKLRESWDLAAAVGKGVATTVTITGLEVQDEISVVFERSLEHPTVNYISVKQLQ